MALLNFKARFVPLIESGEKCHTIRAMRKHPIRVGETLHLYTGLRQKGARLLMRVPCLRVQKIYIRKAILAYDRFSVCWPWAKRCPLCGEQTEPNIDHSCYGPALAIEIDGAQLSRDETEAFMRRDGFPGGSKEALEFWRDRLPFSGQLIHWRKP